MLRYIAGVHQVDSLVGKAYGKTVRCRHLCPLCWCRFGAGNEFWGKSASLIFKHSRYSEQVLANAGRLQTIYLDEITESKKNQTSVEKQ